MRAYRWTILCGLGVVAIIACGSKKDSLGNSGDDASSGNGDDSGVSGSSSGSPPSSSGMTFTGIDAGSGIMDAPSDCKAGRYAGRFTGSYSSGLILGIPLTVTGDVNLTLDQEGDAGTQCMIEGEGFESCSNVFTLSGGTITGVANQAMIGEAAFGGFPYYCGLTGTLDCAKRTLVNGWIQCVYCTSALTDGGTVCSGLGGKFAGPLTADYELSDAGGPPSFGTLASDPGVWNGAESLAGNNGMMPGPDGGPISDYLALDGGYGFLGKFGGSGNWNATLTN
jgi:hypothetical protein